MSRVLLVLLVLIGTAGAVVAYGDPKRIAEAGDAMSTMLKKRVAAATAAAEAAKARTVEIPRGTGGEFAVSAKVNGVAAVAQQPGDRQTGRALRPGSGSAARPDEDQPSRHELPRPPRKLGSPLRPAPAARLSLITASLQAAAISARSVTATIAFNSTLASASGLTPNSDR